MPDLDAVVFTRSRKIVFFKKNLKNIMVLIPKIPTFAGNSDK